MKSPTPFLSADWKELTMINYQLEPIVLQSVLPSGLIPDLRDGSAYVSLVAFDFENVRVKGVAWPGYTRFPEFNLRAYVRCEESDQAGVMFIRELVPGRLPAFLARLLYNEPYTACPMQRQRISHDDGSQTQFTTLAWNGRISQVQARVGPETVNPPLDSDAEWFKEQTWGFGMGHDGELLRYRVSHPRWLLRQLHDVEVDIDWLPIYGPYWAKNLAGVQPDSSFHAIGSEVVVHAPEAMARPHFS